MPTRLLREGILSSDAIDSLDAPAEVFYRRLMSKVDDHGLYDARPSILRASLFPLRTDRVREADISRWMAACQKAGLIVLYEAGGKQYLCLLKTGWEKRSKPKFPLPPETICKQPLTVTNTSTVVVVVDEVVVGDGAKKPRRKPATKVPDVFDVSDEMAQWAVGEGLPAERVLPETEKFLDHFRRKDEAMSDWLAGWRNWVRKSVEYRAR